MNDSQALQCAADQAARDFPYTEVTGSAIYRKIVNEDRKIMSPESTVSAPGDRWYVEVSLRHREDESEGMALYRVWRELEGLQAMKVAVGP